ncbi:uncharacterized protein [Blastocystis hominis]|uniref:Cyclin-dependent kinases regulatory subunit n=1 Tax=Blastocystis hominis TaxID=12968 RepID=D8LYN3_BLAHO|nr:uncharacterized protein [Blastocystis hominis]CBK20688.2 unnamed protein product [Blastocystis hominis]|eukprot:XP_012894736.1 uncharacterized protein [Blastocystis hominis]
MNYASQIDYSDKYYDETYEYRHVTLPKELSKQFPAGKLLTEQEWRSLGIRMSLGWEHYATHKPDPNILLFRRPLGTDGTTGLVNPELAEMQKKQFRKQFGLE